MHQRKNGLNNTLSVLSADVLLAWIGTGTSRQSPARDGESPTYAADQAGSRYRPLGQINTANFNKLEVAWRFKTGGLGTRPEYKLEGTPPMVNSVLYTTAGTRRAVVLGAFVGPMARHQSHLHSKAHADVIKRRERFPPISSVLGYTHYRRA
jgi:glucose dehydrogenase